MNAEYISNALNGKRKGKSFAVTCPIAEHKSAKVILTDGEGGKILVFCQAGCEFRDIVKSFRHQGLWPESTDEEKKFFREQQAKKEKESAIIWIEVFKANPDLRTKKDWSKYWRLKKKHNL